MTAGWLPFIPRTRFHHSSLNQSSRRRTADCIQTVSSFSRIVYRAKTNFMFSLLNTNKTIKEY